MGRLLQIFSKSTLKSMALKVVHYALVALVVAVGLAVLYWRWRRVNNQNKSLEAELRLLQPYHKLGSVPDEDDIRPLTVPMAPRRPAPATVLAPVAAAVPAAPAPAPVQAPPVLTPKTKKVNLKPVQEEDSDDETDTDDEPQGVPPVISPALSSQTQLPAGLSDLLMADVLSMINMPSLATTTSSGISEIVEPVAEQDEKEDEVPAAEEKTAPAEKPAARATTRRRRK